MHEILKILNLPNDSTKKTLFVALALCLACSVVVAASAVVLKPLQSSNQAYDRKLNILRAANLYEPGIDVEGVYAERVEARVVDLATGEYTDAVDPETYDPRQAVRDPELSEALDPEIDIASIKRQERYAPVFLIQQGDALQTIVLPVRGYGLWSTLYGFLALEPDTRTVAGLKFYEHAETPGLGGEIDNADWLEQWRGKVVYGDSWEPQISVIKGNVDPNSPQAEHQVDGLAGATLTSRGVMNLMRYWLSDGGFGPYLARLRDQGDSNRG